MAKMSNNNRPTFRLPGGVPPPPLDPPPALPNSETTGNDVLERFPLPWCVGPYGDIWVAADIEEIEPGADGIRRWKATGDKARLVMENPAGVGIAALIVYAVNKLGKV
jgi:hypothetical protein